MTRTYGYRILDRSAIPENSVARAFFVEEWKTIGDSEVRGNRGRSTLGAARRLFAIAASLRHKFRRRDRDGASGLSWSPARAAPGQGILGRY